MNQVVLMGRLARDPELRRTASGTAVTSFTLAVDRRFTNRETGERTADFIDCVAWRQTGENIARFFSKGQMCAVTGSLQIRDWTDRDGNKRRSAEVVVDNFYFPESKKSREGSSYSAPAEQKRNDFDTGYTAPVTGSDFAELDEDDGDLPF
ncbi:MAG: single-stranded DNA-binding protein [Oscillospiraceae bacterium]|nr:single-stranded DNA-binding protein [Oscillospiraceae bacterium]